MTGRPAGRAAASRSSGFSRRSFLAGAAGAGLLSLAGPGRPGPAWAAPAPPSPPLAYAQTLTFARTIEALDRAPAGSF